MGYSRILLPGNESVQRIIVTTNSVECFTTGTDTYRSRYTRILRQLIVNQCKLRSYGNDRASPIRSTGDVDAWLFGTRFLDFEGFCCWNRRVDRLVRVMAHLVLLGLLELRFVD